MFLGSVHNRDYYFTPDGKELRMVTARPGHKVVTTQRIDYAILQLLSWGERDMVNRIKAARMMLE